MSYDSRNDYQVAVRLVFEAKLDPAKQRLLDTITLSRLGKVAGDQHQALVAAVFFTRHVMKELTGLGYGDGNTEGFELVTYRDAELPDGMLARAQVWKYGRPEVELRMLLAEQHFRIQRIERPTT